MPSPAVSSKEQKTFFKNPKSIFSTLFPTVLAGAAGLIVFLDAISDGGTLAPLAFELVNWVAILVALSLFVGLLSVVGTHVRHISRRQSDWVYSIVLLLSMFLVIVLGVFRVPPGNGGAIFQPNLAEEPIRRFFHAVYEPLTSSLLALLAFFSLSTVIRALQRRSAEVVVIVGVAVLVLIAQLPPIAEQPYVEKTVQWVRSYVALAGARGLLIGVAIGTLVASMRVLLGFDQPYLDN
jgi:hypothetical protein